MEQTMRTRLITLVVALGVLVATYLSGYWPERARRVEVAARADALQTTLALTEARVRVGALLGGVLTVRELVARQDYGQAMERSGTLFDAIRQEAMATPDPGLRTGLNDALGQRDRVTAGLAKGDPATTATLHAIELDLRRALGYDVPVSPSR